MGGTKENVKTGTDTGTNAVTNTGNNTAVKTKKADDSVYTAQELAANARALFNTMPDCVIAALKLAGVTLCTVDDAKTLVKNYLNMEVD